MRVQHTYHIGSGGHLLKVRVLHSNAAVGTQILITKDQNSILIDVGDGTLRDLVDMRFNFETLRTVLLTHEHFDHISGLYSLISFLTLLRRKERLPIITPRPSLRVRTLLRPPLMHYSRKFLISILEASAEDEMQIKPFHVRAFRASHIGGNSLGYSVLDDEGHKVVISGDTRLCPSLEQAVVGADIAVLESTYEDEDRGAAHSCGHMTKSEARVVGRKAKHALLIHGPPRGYFPEIDRACRLK